MISTFSGKKIFAFGCFWVLCIGIECARIGRLLLLRTRIDCEKRLFIRTLVLRVLCIWCPWSISEMMRSTFANSLLLLLLLKYAICKLFSLHRVQLNKFNKTKHSNLVYFMSIPPTRRFFRSGLEASVLWEHLVFPATRGKKSDIVVICSEWGGWDIRIKSVVTTQFYKRKYEKCQRNVFCSHERLMYKDECKKGNRNIK